jgi:RTX calcium-binding nonapeptide repeat (4 copies)
VRGAILVILVVCLAFPAAASAGLAFGDYNDEGDLFVEFSAANGEKNDVTATIRGSRVTFHDSGAPLRAGEVCEAVDSRTVTCPAGDVLDVYTYDLHDVVRLDVPAKLRYLDASAFGGGGDDTLVGGAPRRSTLAGESGNDTLIGGPHGDVLFGGEGDDALRGGAGSDRLWGDGEKKSGRDVITGGRGRDSVWYADRKRPVTVDLRRARPQGAQGEDDTVTEVEDVVGGKRDDQLIGDGGDNVLRGGGGSDVFRAGLGNDLVWIAPGSASRLGCGGGLDVVRRPSSHTLVPAECERVLARGFTVRTDIRSAGPSELRVPIVQHARAVPYCRGVVELSGPYRSGAADRPPSMGIGAVEAPPEAPATVRVTLNAYGRALLARKEPVRVLVSVGGDHSCDGAPQRPPRGFTVHL